MTEILNLPNYVDNFAIDQHKLLKFVYENRYCQDCRFNIEFLHKCLIKNIQNNYFNKAGEEIVFTKMDIKKILK